MTNGLLFLNWRMLALTLLCLQCMQLPSNGADILLDAKVHRLGKAENPEWEAPGITPPDARTYVLDFTLTNVPTSAMLWIRQKDVKLPWGLQINAQRVAYLNPGESPMVLPVFIPTNVLSVGNNRVIILPPIQQLDDIEISEVRLTDEPFTNIMGAARINVAVTDASGTKPLPCRLTIVDDQGYLIPWLFLNNTDTNNPVGAARIGVAYLGEKPGIFGLRPGKYTLYASKGFEYQVVTQQFTVAKGDEKSFSIRLNREVPTPGWVSVDSHIHTRTFSKHGDASLYERQFTIAGEGIELAVATDHNTHTDFSEASARVGLNNHFKHVIGNEVTLKVGHLNAFPISPGSQVASTNLVDWNTLVTSIRATPGVQVVTLNHPRDLHDRFAPFSPRNFNPVTGLYKPNDGIGGVDAMEVVTSAALQSNMDLLYMDWFALLNRGFRIFGVGSSDSHDVNRYILGQARTYVAADDTDITKLDQAQVWKNYKEGRMLVSMGLLTHIKVADRYTVGDLATNLAETVNVNVRVLGPSWITADSVLLLANGVPIRSARIAPNSAVEKTNITWSIPRPPQDVHLVAIATGPGVLAPFWEAPRPYQPTSKKFFPRVIGSTNPVWLDSDGDGKFTAARGYATGVVTKHLKDIKALLEALKGYDQPTSVQAADLCAEQGIDLTTEDFKKLLEAAAPQVKSGFNAVVAAMPAAAGPVQPVATPKVPLRPKN